jgi:hypothetical protein
MPQLSLYQTEEDELNVVNAAFEAGCWIVPDLDYEAPEAQVLKTGESFKQARRDERHFFILHKRFMRSPLHMRQILKHGRNVFYVSPSEGGPFLEFLGGGIIEDNESEEEEWIAACAGAGQAAATRAFAAAEDGGSHRPRLLHRLGRSASRPISPPAPPTTSPASSTSRPASASAATPVQANSGSPQAPKLPTKPKNCRLASTYNAALVDMEAAAIARLAACADPFLCIKASATARRQTPRFQSFPVPERTISKPFVSVFMQHCDLGTGPPHPDGRK